MKQMSKFPLSNATNGEVLPAAFERYCIQRFFPEPDSSARHSSNSIGAMNDAEIPAANELSRRPGRRGAKHDDHSILYLSIASGLPLDRGVNSRLGIFLLLTSQPPCEQAGAAAGSDPVHAAESRFRTSTSYGKHGRHRPPRSTELRPPQLLGV